MGLIMPTSPKIPQAKISTFSLYAVAGAGFVDYLHGLVRKCIRRN